MRLRDASPGTWTLGIVFLLRTAAACSQADPSWTPATPAAQWLGAGYVVEGTVSEIGDTNVLISDVRFAKGVDHDCSNMTVEGFVGESLCGLDPPRLGTRPTFYLCAVMHEETEQGTCRARLNTQGDVRLGVTEGPPAETDPSLAPATCRQLQGICASVDLCNPDVLQISAAHSLGASSASHVISFGLVASAALWMLLAL